MLTLVLAFVLAFLFALYGTPLAMQAARRYGIVDRPDGRLKTQAEPVPYLGGLAVYVSFLLAYGIVFDFRAQVLGLLFAASVVVMLGLLDDFGALTPKVKFLGQALAAYILIRSDIVTELSFLPPWANALLSAVWIIGMMNAFNIVDVLDGLAAGLATVAAGFFLFISVAKGETFLSFMAATLLGSALGFLRYNFHPARIYLGDTGSMFLGLVLGSFALVADYSAVNDFGFLTPVFLLCVPIFDTAYVSILRTLKGKPFYFGSPDHYALRLLRKWKSAPSVALASYLAACAGGVAGIINMVVTPAVSLLLLGVMAFFFTIGGVWLARDESGLAGEGTEAPQE